jgi:hypothetical protein
VRAILVLSLCTVLTSRARVVVVVCVKKSSPKKNSGERPTGDTLAPPPLLSMSVSQSVPETRFGYTGTLAQSVSQYPKLGSATPVLSLSQYPKLNCPRRLRVSQYPKLNCPRRLRGPPPKLSTSVTPDTRNSTYVTDVDMDRCAFQGGPRCPRVGQRSQATDTQLITDMGIQ